MLHSYKCGVIVSGNCHDIYHSFIEKNNGMSTVWIVAILTTLWPPSDQWWAPFGGLPMFHTVLPPLLNPLRRKLGTIYANDAYDSEASHQLIAGKGATACIPPRKNAGLWKKGHPRNEVVLVMRKEGLDHWKKTSGYHRRSLAETAMCRLRQLMAGKICLRKYNCQVGEVIAYVSEIKNWTPLVCLSESPKCSGHLGLWTL